MGIEKLTDETESIIGRQEQKKKKKFASPFNLLTKIYYIIFLKWQPSQFALKK
jgi:hypothetical protein